MTTDTLDAATELSTDAERELHSFAQQLGREMRKRELAGREDSIAYRELEADRAAAAERVRRSHAARQQREAASRRADAAARADAERRKAEHEAEVDRATDWLREALDGGARERDALLRDAEEAGLCRWEHRGDMPMSRPGVWHAGALLEAAQQLGVMQYLGERAAVMWTLSWVPAGQRAEDLGV